MSPRQWMQHVRFRLHRENMRHLATLKEQAFRRWIDSRYQDTEARRLFVHYFTAMQEAATNYARRSRT
jgi:hypothetical protein